MTVPETDIQTTAAIIRRAYGKDSVDEALRRWKEALADDNPVVAAVWRRVWARLDGRLTAV